MKVLEFCTGRDQVSDGKGGFGNLSFTCLQKIENVQIIENVAVEKKILSVGNPKLAPSPSWLSLLTQLLTVFSSINKYFQLLFI